MKKHFLIASFIALLVSSNANAEFVLGGDVGYASNTGNADGIADDLVSYSLGIPLLAFYVSDPSPLWEGFGSYRELQAYRRAQKLANMDARCPAPVGGSSIVRAQRELEYAKCRYNNAIKAGTGDLHKRRQSVVVAQRKLLAAQRRGYSNAPEGTLEAMLRRLRVQEPGGAYDLNGKKHGRWIERQPNGDVFEGRYINGKRHGHWILRFTDERGVQEGHYVDGEMQGHWVLRFAVGGVEEGPVVNGNKHGNWVHRFDNGVAEGEYVDSKRHGHWVERYADGDVREIPHKDGKRHGQGVYRQTNGRVERECWENENIVDC